MTPVGIVLLFGAYGLGTWGYLLVRGENITLREWFSPIHPYTGALDANGKVPSGKVWPTAKAA